ncbi:P-loop NTPase fold protein [Saprospira sp. CCB-QB6]|nr:P-loop NTPase fold protein [Saprospira sp. CCB-QB6]WCL82250.1 P-loop NTPase fold protein [Saprospira sp. CCB-QB6]
MAAIILIKKSRTAHSVMKKPYVIGITGGSGSGKTTFLSALEQEFGKDQICILSADHYYRPREEQEADDQGILNFDLPSSINAEELERDVRQLIAGQDIERQEYTFNNPLVEPQMLKFKAAPILILEGIFVFHYPQVADLIDLKVFLYTSESTALSRRIKRDRIERNYPLEDVLYRYEHHVMPTYRQYIAPIKEQADLLINNNHKFDAGLKVFKGFINNYLQEAED